MHPGPQRYGADAAPAETQQFYQCCVCNEFFTSAKNVRYHFARMRQPPAQASTLASSSNSAVRASLVPVPWRVREPHGANDALKAAHSSVACQWQLVQINSAARALALALGSRRRGTQAQAGTGPGTGTGAGPGTTTTVCPGPRAPERQALKIPGKPTRTQRCLMATVAMARQILTQVLHVHNYI